MDTIDYHRNSRGFLTVKEVAQTIGETNILLDPYSLLISRGVTVGDNNIFYPNVVLERTGQGVVVIGNGNVFYPGVYILGAEGAVQIADKNEFGTGGCTIKANMPDTEVVIGNGGRYCDGVSIMGRTTLGNGSQVLGAITVQSCTLAAGGTFTEADPDKRASVLKGFGLARGITLEKGQVVNGAGSFADAPVEWQRAYHPKPKKA